MPVLGKRTWTQRRRTLRRRKIGYLPRRTRISRGMVKINNNIHSFKRTVNSANILIDNTGYKYGALTFKLSDLSNYTEFVNLYDQYRILGVKVEFRPRVTSADANPLSTLVQFGDLVTAIDHNDSSAPGSQNELYAYKRMKTTNMLKGQTRYIKPSVLIQMYESAISTGYGSKWRQWLDTNDYDVPHYGLKYAIAPSNSATTVTIGVILTFYFQCKDFR